MTNLEKQLQDALRQSEDQLDSATNYRLCQTRASALKAEGNRSLPRFFIPLAATAAASILAVLVVFSPMTQDIQRGSSQEEFLLSEEIDLYEDIEFYSWLASDTDRLRG